MILILMTPRLSCSDVILILAVTRGLLQVTVMPLLNVRAPQRPKIIVFVSSFLPTLTQR